MRDSAVTGGRGEEPTNDSGISRPSQSSPPAYCRDRLLQATEKLKRQKARGSALGVEAEGERTPLKALTFKTCSGGLETNESCRDFIFKRQFFHDQFALLPVVLDHDLHGWSRPPRFELEHAIRWSGLRRRTPAQPVAYDRR